MEIQIYSVLNYDKYVYVNCKSYITLKLNVWDQGFVHSNRYQ